MIAAVLMLFAGATAANADSDTIAVSVDQAKLVKLPGRVATLVVGNPLIADVTLQSGGVIVVTGKGYGATNVIAMDRAGDILVDRTRLAMEQFERDFPEAGRKTLVVAGGVAANRAIGAALARLCAGEGFGLAVPPPTLCTDNAAMIAWAGLEKLAAGGGDDLTVAPRARWPLASAL